jgi:hypothetical protein
MSDNITCGQCGEPITGEHSGLETSQRKSELTIRVWDAMSFVGVRL